MNPHSSPAGPPAWPARTRVGVVVGNPKPASRTFQAAVRLAADLAGRSGAVADADTAVDLVLDLAAFGPRLLDWSDAEVGKAVGAVSDLDLVVVASPTYKGAYTGLLKLFLDRFPADALDGVVAVPLMLGAGPAHALAPEVFLKPVLAELGAVLPTRALYVLDAEYDQARAYEPWLTSARPRIAAALHPGVLA